MVVRRYPIRVWHKSVLSPVPRYFGGGLGHLRMRLLVSSLGVCPDLLRVEDMAARKVEGGSVGDHHREPSCHTCDNTPLTPYFQTGFASAMGAIIFAILVSSDLFLIGS